MSMSIETMFSTIQYEVTYPLFRETDHRILQVQGTLTLQSIKQDTILSDSEKQIEASKLYVEESLRRAIFEDIGRQYADAVRGLLMSLNNVDHKNALYQALGKIEQKTTELCHPKIKK